MTLSRPSQLLAQGAESWVCSSCRQKWRKLNRTWTRSAAGLASRNPKKTRKSPRNAYQTRLDSSRSYAAGTSTGGVKPRAKGNLPDRPARTRFAPSPTGYMHIGGLRTALFSYLLAKRTNGQFVLRIEDTDQKRLVHDAEERLCEDLQWAGLQWDEGPQVRGPYGPYKQSERNQIYQKHSEILLEDGSAYRCFCTSHSIRSAGTTAAYVTSGCYQDCASLPIEEAQDKAEVKREAFTVRLKQPLDVHKRAYNDLIYGKIQRLKRSPTASPGGEDNAGLDAADTVLIKSDGTPTYHFANVVDDHLMRITHVIRGAEWMASTPLHYDLYSAFGWEPPSFAHVGLLVDENQAKLSKRSSSGLVLDVKGMREQNGVLPEVLCNFLTLLGWSNPDRNDVLEMEELIKTFDLKFTKGNTIVRTEKLWYLQKQHVSRKLNRLSHPHDAEITANMLKEDLESIKSIVQRVRQEVTVTFAKDINGATDANIDLEAIDAYILDVLRVDSKSYETPQKYAERNRYFFDFDPSQVPPDRENYDKHGLITAAQLQKVCQWHLFGPRGPENDSNRSAEEIRQHWSIYQHGKQELGSWKERWSVAPEEDPKAGTVYREHSLVTRAMSMQDRLHAAAATAASSTLKPREADHSPSADDRTKAMGGALNRYLRDKLAYGLPGPSVHHIMAILGVKECCKRLGINEEEN